MKKIDIYDVLEGIKIRTGMFIGENKISALRSFIDGYFHAISLHKIKTKPEFPNFWYFHEWAMQKYHWGESTTGWKNIILQENDNEEEKALKVFFEMLEEFKTLKPINIQKMVITKQNLNFCLANISSFYYNADGSQTNVYENPDNVFLVEFSHNFGFSYFITEKNKNHTCWRSRYKNEKIAKKSIENIFGEQQIWEILSGNLTNILKKVLR